jgi:hypothetical protein
MISESIAIFVILVFFLTMLKVYMDWSGFEKRARSSNYIDFKDAKKTATKISMVSFIAGISLGLLVVTVRLASPSNSVESVGALLYLVYVLSCSTVWAFILVISFVLKVITLKSLYKKNQ